MRLAQSHAVDQVLNSCMAAIKLMPELAWLGASISDRCYQIKEAGRIARVAAAVVIPTAKYKLAVEWLEQGRSIIWNQMLQLCSPMDDLEQDYPKLASDLRFLSLQLEGSTTRTLDNQTDNANHLDYSTLAHDREKLLAHIHSLNGFDRFLLSKSFSQLKCAAKEGPVVMLSIADTGCDALVVQECDHVLRVPLPTVNLDRVRKWHQDLRDAVAGCSRDHLETVSPTGTGFHRTYSRVLTELWCGIVRPILDALKITIRFPSVAIRRLCLIPFYRKSIRLIQVSIGSGGV
jgi:hypothetical protein